MAGGRSGGRNRCRRGALARGPCAGSGCVTWSGQASLRSPFTEIGPGLDHRRRSARPAQARRPSRLWLEPGGTHRRSVEAGTSTRNSSEAAAPDRRGCTAPLHGPGSVGVGGSDYRWTEPDFRPRRREEIVTQSDACRPAAFSVPATAARVRKPVRGEMRMRGDADRLTLAARGAREEERTPPRQSPPGRTSRPRTFCPP